MHRSPLSPQYLTEGGIPDRRNYLIGDALIAVVYSELAEETRVPGPEEPDVRYSVQFHGEHIRLVETPELAFCCYSTVHDISLVIPTCCILNNFLIIFSYQ